MLQSLSRFAAGLAMLAIGAQSAAFAQAGLQDDRVLLQGFYWESHRHGLPQFKGFGTKRWYQIVHDVAPQIRDGGFDLIWLPPTAFSGGGEGYAPQEYFNAANDYGTLAQHRAMLEALLQQGVEPIADVVINHRNGSKGWADFTNPAWGTWAICADDEAFSNPQSGITKTPMNQRGKCEELEPEYTMPVHRSAQYNAYRDIAHNDQRVRQDIVRYLLFLKSLGYRGWRYDMVHGYHAKWIALYNRLTEPTFSVGEYDWGNQPEQRGWVKNTAPMPLSGGANPLEKSSDVFDFQTFFKLKDAINGNRYTDLARVGLITDTTDGLPWKQRAVTFAENHDTGFRTNADGTPMQGNTSDSFANGPQVEQAYAFILTHPGVPSVYWKHYFDWGPDLRARIQALINARKVAGVHAGSSVATQDNARNAGVYAARVDGKNGTLYVRVGGSDAQWNPAMSQYTGFREYAAGNGWKVWVAMPGNPPVQQAPKHAPFPIPQQMTAQQIQLPPVP